jgi:cation transporter-like permease
MNRIGASLAIFALLGMVAAVAWALWATGALNFRGGTTVSIAIIAAGVLLTGALAGAFMWLAFYSSRKGYDEAPKIDRDTDAA